MNKRKWYYLKSMIDVTMLILSIMQVQTLFLEYYEEHYFFTMYGYTLNQTEASVCPLLWDFLYSINKFYLNCIQYIKTKIKEDKYVKNNRKHTTNQNPISV